jgi:hypothetical protein
MTRDWIVLAAGPLAWFAALVADWMLTPGAHEAGSVAALYAIDAAALVVALVACALAARRLRANAPDRFVVVAGLGIAALSAVLVIGLAIPLVLLLPGAEP